MRSGVLAGGANSALMPSAFGISLPKPAFYAIITG